MALVLVVGLFWVPIAVRSAKRIGVRGANTLRLNHGFDLPVQRQSAPPADVVTFASDLTTVHADIVCIVCALTRGGDDLPAQKLSAPPDPVRGPPAFVLA